MRFLPINTLFTLLLLQPSSSFLLQPTTFHPPRTTTTTTKTTLHAIGVLARKAKELDVQTYIDNGLPESVQSKLTQIESSSSQDSSSSIPTPLQDALTKRKGTITIIAEYKRRLDKGGFIDEIFNPEILSPTFREFGATAVAVMADERMGGCTYDDLVTLKQEQESARGDVPGPCLIISSDLIVSEVQLARSKDCGADAVVLSMDVIGEEKVGRFLEGAKRVGLECVVNVGSLEEAQKAVDLGGRILCVTGAKDAEEKFNVIGGLKVPEGENVCTVATISARDDKSLEEVEEAWRLRDKGFNAVWVSECLYKSGNDPAEHPGAVIRSMKAKSSVKYASPKARSGKGEGSREYLGDIMM